VATNFVLSHSSWRLKHNRWWKDANHLINKNDEKAQFSIEATSDVPAEIVVATPVVSLDMLRDERVPVSVAIKGQFLSNPVELTITTTDLISGEKSISTIQFLAPPLRGRRKCQILNSNTVFTKPSQECAFAMPNRRITTLPWLLPRCMRGMRKQRQRKCC
jgi:hypothetical protein